MFRVVILFSGVRLCELVSFVSGVSLIVIMISVVFSSQVRQCCSDLFFSQVVRCVVRVIICCICCLKISLVFIFGNLVYQLNSGLCRIQISILLISVIMFISNGRLKLCQIVRLYFGSCLLRLVLVVVVSSGVMVQVGSMLINRQRNIRIFIGIFMQCGGLWGGNFGNWVGLLLKNMLWMKCSEQVIENMLVRVVIVGISQLKLFSRFWLRVLLKNIFLLRKLFSSGILVIVREVMMVSIVVCGRYFYILLIRCMLWLLVLWLMILVVMNSEVLKVVWLMMWNIVVMFDSGELRLNSRVIRFRWLIVEQVSSFFRLCWNSVMLVFSNSVIRLFRLIRQKNYLVLVSVGYSWVSRNMLVLIMVVECRYVEIGVGVVIVWGSQKWKGNCVDLVNMLSRISISISGYRVWVWISLLVVRILVSLKLLVMWLSSSILVSSVRLFFLVMVRVIFVFLWVLEWLFQKLMSRNEDRLVSFQKSIISKRFFVSIMLSMEFMNSSRKVKKCFIGFCLERQQWVQRIISRLMLRISRVKRKLRLFRCRLRLMLIFGSQEQLVVRVCLVNIVLCCLSNRIRLISGVMLVDVVYKVWLLCLVSRGNNVFMNGSVMISVRIMGYFFLMVEFLVCLVGGVFLWLLVCGWIVSSLKFYWLLVGVV